MTYKTSLRRIWENPLHPVWVILALFELGVFIACINRFVLESDFIHAVTGWGRPFQLESYLEDANSMLGTPYRGAGGLRVTEAIAVFSGKSVSGTWSIVHSLMGISMVLAYIVGPSLLVWGLKKRNEWLVKKPPGRSSFVPLIATSTGCYMIVIALLIPTVTTVKSWTVWQTMKSESYINTVRDGAGSSVSTLGFQAQQLRLKPEVKGGGPWVKGPGGITITDIDTVLPRLERGLWGAGVLSPMKYMLEVESPDSLTIWGVASVQGQFRGASFANKDGSTGKVQVHVGVTQARVTTWIDN